MKQRISLTIDEQTLALIENALVKNPTQFRNRSHAVEAILTEALQEVENE